MHFDRALLDQLFGYCLSLSGTRDAAYDLVQGAIESYLRDAPADVNHPYAYLRRIARNRFIDERRRADVVAFESLEHSDHPVQAEADLEQVMIDRSTLERLWLRFTPAEREALYLWAVEDMTASEIALQLGQPRPTILSRLRRARLRIQAEDTDASRVQGAS